MKKLCVVNCYATIIMSLMTVSYHIVSENYFMAMSSVPMALIALFMLRVMIPMHFKDLPMDKEITAMLFGGPNDGQTVVLSQPQHVIYIAECLELPAVELGPHNASPPDPMPCFTKHGYKFSAMKNDDVAYYKYMN